MWIANADSVTWYDPEHWLNVAEFQGLKTLATEGSRILEIGAHHGFTALLLAKFVGATGAVTSVEAHPFNAMVDQAQLGLNRSVTNLEFIHSVAADSPGARNIVPGHNSNVTSQSGNDLIEVQAVTGDLLDDNRGPFNFLKVDVEGYELEVLKGCRSLLERAPKLALELHLDLLRERGHSVTDVFDLIQVGRYRGEMALRPDSPNVLRPFSVSALPDAGIVNVFLSAKDPTSRSS